MPPKTWLIPLATVFVILSGAAVLHGESQTPHAQAAAAAARENAPSRQLVSGEVSQTVKGDLTVRIPAELALTDDRFDLLVHFHGAAPNQAANVDEAKLSAVVVSVNDGLFSDAYAKAFASPDALGRVIKAAEQEVVKRAPEARVGRIALSAWSAGAAAVGKVLAQSADRIDTVILADGLFSYWANDAKTDVAKAPLQPFIDFARGATNGDKLFVLTHTAIPTDYPNVEACTNAILEDLELARQAPGPATQASGGQPTSSVDQGDFHVRGYDGKGPNEHIEQIRALDDAYSELRRRWER